MRVSLCALGVGGRLREELDVRILRSHESPALLEMWNRWFSVGHGQTPTTVLQLEVVGPAMGLLCTYGLLQIFNLLGQRIVKRGGSKATSCFSQIDSRIASAPKASLKTSFRRLSSERNSQFGMHEQTHFVDS